MEKDQVVALDAYQRGLASFDPDNLESGNGEGETLAMSPAEQAAREAVDAAEKKAADEKKLAEKKTAEAEGKGGDKGAAEKEAQEVKDEVDDPAETAENGEEKIAIPNDNASERVDPSADAASTETTARSTSTADSDTPILE